MPNYFSPESPTVLSFIIKLGNTHKRNPGSTKTRSQRTTQKKTPNASNASTSEGQGHLQTLLNQTAQENGYNLLSSLGDQGSIILKARKNDHVVAMKLLLGRRQLPDDDNDNDNDYDNEFTIIMELQKLDSLQNHTIKVLQTYHCDHSGSPYDIIVMPWQSSLDGFLSASPTTADSLWYQFLEGVGFLHNHGIAHLDLKPGNVLVGFPGVSSLPRLSIIDFGISVRVKSEATKVQGYRGTPSWSAPEVGTENGPVMSYSPILADRWSCGQVLRHIRSFHQIDDASAFLSTQNQLLRSDPSARPSLSQLLNSLYTVYSVERGGDTDCPSVLQKRRRSSCWFVYFSYKVLSLKFICRTTRTEQSPLTFYFGT